MRRCTRAGWRERTHLPGCIDARARWRCIFGHRVQHRTHCGVKKPASISCCRHVSPPCQRFTCMVFTTCCRSVSVPDHNLLRLARRCRWCAAAFRSCRCCISLTSRRPKFGRQVPAAYVHLHIHATSGLIDRICRLRGALCLCSVLHAAAAPLTIRHRQIV